MEHQQAITDLIDFIAEFELWLEDMTPDSKPFKRDGIEAKIKYDVMWEVLGKWRECKNRIEYSNDE